MSDTSRTLASSRAPRLLPSSQPVCCAHRCQEAGSPAACFPGHRRPSADLGPAGVCCLRTACAGGARQRQHGWTDPGLSPVPGGPAADPLVDLWPLSSLCHTEVLRAPASPWGSGQEGESLYVLGENQGYGGSRWRLLSCQGLASCWMRHLYPGEQSSPIKSPPTSPRSNTILGLVRASPTLHIPEGNM